MFNMLHSRPAVNLAAQPPIASASLVLNAVAAHLAALGLRPTISPVAVVVTVDGQRWEFKRAEDDFPQPARSWAAVWHRRPSDKSEG